MKRIYLLGALLPLSAAALYPSGYGLKPATPVFAPSVVSSGYNIYALPQYQFGGAAAVRPTNPLCDPSFGMANRRLPSWCAQAPSPSVPTTVVTNAPAWPPRAATVGKQSYATVNTYNQSAPATLSSNPIKAFRVTLSHPAAGGRTFQNALQVDELAFRLMSNNVDGPRYDDFEVLVDGAPTPVDARGVALFSPATRLAPGQEAEFEVAVRLRPQPVLPNYSGSFQLELSDIIAYNEGARTRSNIKFNSKTRSQFMAFSPFVSFQTGPNVEVLLEGIDEAKPLTSNQTRDVLKLHIAPRFADLSLRELIIENTTGADVQAVFERLTLHDAATGEILDSAVFVGNTATFRTEGPLATFPINVTRALTVSATMKDDIPATNVRLDATATGIDFISLTSGNEVSAGRIQLVRDTATTPTTTASSTLTVRHAADQPTTFAPTSQREPAYHFDIANPGDDTLYLSQFTLQVGLGGIDWATTSGIPQTSDFRVVRRSDGQNYFSSAFIPTGVTTAGDVTFVAAQPLVVGPNATKSFALLVAATPITTSTNDEVRVAWRRDATLQTGSISSLQSGGAKLIYTDDRNQNVWYSGAGLMVPSAAVVVSR